MLSYLFLVFSFFFFYFYFFFPFLYSNYSIFFIFTSIVSCFLLLFFIFFFLQGPLLDRATKWYLKASQALKASLLRPHSSPRFGGGAAAAAPTAGAEVVVKYFEDALQEVERVRDRVKRGAGVVVVGTRMGASSTGLGSGEWEGRGGGDFGGRGAVNALELARAALDTER